MGFVCDAIVSLTTFFCLCVSCAYLLTRREHNLLIRAAIRSPKTFLRRMRNHQISCGIAFATIVLEIVHHRLILELLVFL